MRLRRILARVVSPWLAMCGVLLALGAPVARAQLAATATLPAPAEGPVDFARDVQPLFAKRCFSCHSAEKVESSLRLDQRDDALRGGNNGPAWIAGKSAESRLILYVAGMSPDEIVMPPEGERLPDSEIALLRTWIDRGATWPDELATARLRNADHWSFQPIGQPAPPAISHPERGRNAIDAFVLARLDQEGIESSPEADRATLIRRLSLDLLGLPPTPAEVDEFVADARTDAYEIVVDRLLSSRHYGERWGRHWLDLARYADSDGYEKDTGRPHAWRFRNWVIEALNRDVPFDRFTVQQLAGDLLPDDEPDARIATGFHRNTLTNREGGVDPEEDRVKATVDRVNTTGSVWLGLTVGCAQCHSHKYDPLSQREYYGLFAFFNSLQETETPAPLPEQVAAYELALTAHRAEHARLAQALTDYEQQSQPARQAAWEQSLDLSRLTAWTLWRPTTAASAGGATLANQPDGAVLASGASPDTDTYTLVGPSGLAGVTGLKLEALSDPSLPAQGPGRVAHGNFVLSELKLTVTQSTGEPQPAPLANATADFAQDGFPIASALDSDTKTGWAVAPQFGRDHTAVIETAAAGVASGDQLTLTLDQQHGMQHTLGKLRVWLTASAAPLNAAGVTAEVAAALAIPAAQRTPDQQVAVTAYYRTQDDEWLRLQAAVTEHAKQSPVDPATVTKAQTLGELAQPRVTRVMIRGEFLRPGAEVEPHTPAVLPAIAPRAARPDRLDLARWLVDPANPLTARVAVNRVWQRYFGRGLVATDEDFGTQGERPSHPELLDWLAREFMARGWSLKALHRMIVTSATYRQSSAARPELIDRDPANVLLARQRRLRVEAEVIRDLSLAASGLLHSQVGGPSVRPRQPAGVSEVTYAGSAKWVESEGADRHRRGLYTWFQRTSPYPMLMTFDAPDSNVACTCRERSNTPLQALTLLNDPVFFECAQALARRMAREGSADPRLRLEHGFRLCLARRASENELNDLSELYAAALELCQQDAASAVQLAGDAPAEGVSPAELGALVVVARTLLNLDEFISRE